MSRQRFDPERMPLEGIRLIEASAGTGKTFSLAGLYLRLLLEKKLSVREILVITYTRAATKELRERIRQRLVDAAQVARGAPIADPDSAEDRFAEAIIADSDEAREAIARRLAEAANRMDEATITTIHGFSQRAAAENAFDSALPFERGEQVDDPPVYEEAVADYWRSKALGASAVPGFVGLWPTPDKLGKALSSCWSRPHAQLAGPEDREIEKLAQKVRKAWSKSREEFEQAWRDCWRDDALLKSENLYKCINGLGGIDAALALLDASLASSQPIPILPAWAAELKNPQERFKKNAQERGESLSSDPLTRDLCRLQALTRLAALRQAREHVKETATARKRQRRQFSFDDMIASLHSAVTDPATGPRLADALFNTWPWALVDEFQDTDPLQYEILRRIYGERDAGGLILIGDPKQAIYGFRGGDVLAYLSAAADAGGHAYSLDTNYRSTQGLLDAVETLFRAPGDDAFLVEGIEYQTVKAGRSDKRSLVLDGAALAPMTLWHMAIDSPNKDSAQDACLQACVDLIARLLNPRQTATVYQHNAATGQSDDRKLAPRDVAVLVNTNQEAGEIQRALSGIGIPAVCLHQDSVFASQEAFEILHVLKAAASPSDEGALRAALTSELLGCRLGDLVAMEDDERRWQDEIDRFQHAHEVWRANGVLAMLQPLIQRAAERLLGYVDGERRVSNHLQLAELLAGAESETFGMTGLVRWLRQAITRADDGPAGDAEQLRLDSDEALVRIATVHKAKGLEYAVVFVPFAPWLGAKGCPDKPPHAFHDEQRQALIDIIGTDDNRDEAIREARAEGLRLLYVALTRTELACFLPWGAANGTPNSALASLLHREDGVEPSFWGGKAKAEPLTNERTRARLEALAERAPDAIAIAPLPRFSGMAQHLPPPAPPSGGARTDLPAPRPPWSIYSFTRLVKAAEPGPAAGGADDETPTIEPVTDAARERLPDLPGGLAFGSAVHALLETADPSAWPAPEEPLPSARRAAVAGTLRRYGVGLPDGIDGEAMIVRTADMIRRTLHTPLPAIGPLAAVANTSRLPEMEFMLRLRGQTVGKLLDRLNAAGYAGHLPREQQANVLQGLMHGFIDLVVEHQGRYYVIDHKTNWLGRNAEDYEAPALKQAVQQRHYDLQYLIYVTALHRYLGQRLSDYEPERHLGGAFYLFTRGMAPDAGARGIYFDRPEVALIEHLDTLLDAPGKVA